MPPTMLLIATMAMFSQSLSKCGRHSHHTVGVVKAPSALNYNVTSRMPCVRVCNASGTDNMGTRQLTFSAVLAK